MLTTPMTALASDGINNLDENNDVPKGEELSETEETLNESVTDSMTGAEDALEEALGTLPTEENRDDDDNAIVGDLTNSGKAIGSIKEDISELDELNKIAAEAKQDFDDFVDEESTKLQENFASNVEAAKDKAETAKTETDTAADNAEKLNDENNAAQQITYENAQAAQDALSVAQDNADKAEAEYAKAVEVDAAAQESLNNAEASWKYLDQEMKNAEEAYKTAQVAVEEAQAKLEAILSENGITSADGQYDGDAKAAIDAAQAAFDKASEELEEAETARDEAQGKADEAQGKYEEAQGKADEAQRLADEAKEKLNSANSDLNSKTEEYNKAVETEKQKQEAYDKAQELADKAQEDADIADENFKTVKNDELEALYAKIKEQQIKVKKEFDKGYSIYNDAYFEEAGVLAAYLVEYTFYLQNVDGDTTNDINVKEGNVYFKDWVGDNTIAGNNNYMEVVYSTTDGVEHTAYYDYKVDTRTGKITILKKTVSMKNGKPEYNWRGQLQFEGKGSENGGLKETTFDSASDEYSKQTAKLRAEKEKADANLQDVLDKLKDFIETADKAQEDANTAKDAADKAQEDANTAKDAADKAKTVADTAKEDANTAEGNANNKTTIKDAMENALKAVIDAVEDLFELNAEEKLAENALDVLRGLFEKADKDYTDAKEYKGESAANVERAKIAAESAREIANGSFDYNTPSGGNNPSGGEGGSSDDVDDTTPTTPVVVPVVTPEEIPTAVVTPVAGGAGAGAGAGAAQNLVDIEDEDTPLAAEIDNADGSGDANGGDGDDVLVAGAEEDEAAIVAIEDEETPLASGSRPDGKMSWWWLLIVALLGATGYKMYKDHQKKKEEAAQEA